MRKFPHHLLALFIVVLITPSHQCLAEEITDNLFFQGDNLGFFDNREVKSPYQRSGTYFGTRLGAELGLRQGKSSVCAGYYLIEDFGQHALADHGWTLYYAYRDRHWSGAFGSLPRRLLQRELPDVFVDEATRYYTPNLGGALIQYHSRGVQAELYCDWLSKQSYTEREIFEIVSDGNFRLAAGRYGSLSLGYNARLTHFSVRKGSTPDRVYDKLMLNPFLSCRLRGSILDSATFTGGWMASLNRDRTDDEWKFPMGFLGDVKLNKGRFELRDRLYAGQPLMSDFDRYGTLLHRGDPYYRSPFYDRLDVTYYLLRSRRVNCHATASFHFTEGVMDNSQQIHVSLLF